MKKRTIIFILAVAVIAAATIGATLAYFTDKEEANNIFTIGNVNIELTEPNWAEEVSSVYPGQVLDKDPMVTNIGANPCIVRIKVLWPTLPGDNIPNIGYRTGDLDSMLGDSWKDGGDGYFYYLEPLLPEPDATYPDLGIVTTPLFEQVVIPTELVNGDGDTMYRIDVMAEAVQAQGILPDYNDLLDGISDAELIAIKVIFNIS